MDVVASRYAELWRAVRLHEGVPRSQTDVQFLLDQVRSALDRHVSDLAGDDGCDLIANSFWDEGVVHAGDRVQMHRLRHRDLGTHHAMKTLVPDNAADVVSAGFILREARIMQRLRHPAIVAADVLLRLSDGRPALVMEWMGGGSIANLLRSGGPIGATALRRIVSGLLGGLAAIHEAGLVHADISPQNLLLTKGDDPALKIADFGIALEANESLASLGIRRGGTPGFDDENRTANPERDLRAAGKIVALMLERLASEGGSSALREIAAMLQEGKGITARDALARLGAA
ncbi:protein kinase [Nitratireductor sp. ZSWI3]|uniref:protein kinase domain-containing protein n=1 Tax=Nitratireductor sp. ZSWI3 TaxID=2966359 RepID=UPI00215041A8|nr:protein kinase [Nitratireductor sp. ZSWI3]MCR4266305.1 protein kinase [Nitratireductor sp. ZSWI3]